MQEAVVAVCCALYSGEWSIFSLRCCIRVARARATVCRSVKVPGTTAYHDKTNNLTVIVDEKFGRVVTVDFGIIKQ